ncbi:receptor-transporting protein 3-like [Phyllobates terribilis]|uniref:receptor-transporting protein 3-like n=1 Tax=Phyllobates terribilis TaxID=111132 RepID=UPI003CCAF0F6
MEIYKWQSLFENETQNQGINYEWTFCMDEHLQEQHGYLKYTQHTFASFQCSRCGRRWNSVQVHVLFLIQWSAKSRCGTVNMKIFRQRCRRCNISTFEKPDISNENSKRVIMNLVSKIQCKIHKWKHARPPLEPEVYSDHIEGPHEKKYCEACKMKVCPWNAVCRDKTMVAMPTSGIIFPRATSRVGEKNGENFWATDTTAGHESQDNGQVIACIIFLIFLLLLVVFVIFITK